MSGEKIEQARGAAKFVLNNLREDDLFNIVAYDSEITTFRPELQKFNDETRAAAIDFVDGLYAGGSTDIDGALNQAMGLVENERPTYVLFLTDGLPTEGETDTAEILDDRQPIPVVIRPRMRTAATRWGPPPKRARSWTIAHRIR